METCNPSIKNDIAVKIDVVYFPVAMVLRSLESTTPFSRPAFSAISGYGSLTWGLRNSSCFSANISQHMPSRDPM